MRQVFKPALSFTGILRIDTQRAMRDLIEIPLEGVTVSPIENHIPYFFGQFTPHGSPLTPSIDAVIEALSETCRTLMPDFRQHNPHAYEKMVHATVQL